MRVGLPRQMYVLRNRNFLLYWLGQLVSLTGTWMQALAQGWLVLKITGSVAALGVVNVAFAAPSLVLTLTGGVVADRWDRRRIMIATQTLLMLIALLTAALVVTDRLTFPLLLLMSVLVGTASAYDMPAQQALVPDLVSPPEIPQAIAMNQVIFNGSRLLGPALAGLALTHYSIASLYFINGISFIAVIASLLLIRLPAGAGRGGARGSMMAALREGLRFVGGSRLLRGLMGTAALTVLLTFPAMAVLPPAYVEEMLGRGPGVLGTLMAVGGGASMLGAFGMLWIPVRRRGRVQAACVVALSLTLGALALMPELWVVVVATGLMSLAFSLFMGLNATTIQQLAPGALRGRVMSVSMLSFSGMMPVGALIMSAAVARAGFPVVYLVVAVIYIIAAGAVLLPSGALGYRPAPQPTPSDDLQGPAAPREAVRETEPAVR